MLANFKFVRKRENVPWIFCKYNRTLSLKVSAKIRLGTISFGNNITNSQGGEGSSVFSTNRCREFTKAISEWNIRERKEQHRRSRRTSSSLIFSRYCNESKEQEGLTIHVPRFVLLYTRGSKCACPRFTIPSSDPAISWPQQSILKQRILWIILREY